MEVKKLRGDELKWDQQYEVNVTLDPDTINPQLILSEDGKQKVGLFGDYGEGLLSFYDVEARVQIYSAAGCT
ncbi:unnamed protein product [Boreogadus saida]